jgi:hypothetical protein
MARFFSRYYVDEGIRQDDFWRERTDDAVIDFAADAEAIFSLLPKTGKPGRAETETLVIF